MFINENKSYSKFLSIYIYIYIVSKNDFLKFQISRNDLIYSQVIKLLQYAIDGFLSTTFL